MLIHRGANATKLGDDIGLLLVVQRAQLRRAARIDDASAADNCPSISAAVSASKLRRKTAALRMLALVFIADLMEPRKTARTLERSLSPPYQSTIARYRRPRLDLRAQYPPDRL